MARISSQSCSVFISQFRKPIMACSSLGYDFGVLNLTWLRVFVKVSGFTLDEGSMPRASNEVVQTRLSLSFIYLRAHRGVANIPRTSSHPLPTYVRRPVIRVGIQSDSFLLEQTIMSLGSVGYHNRATAAPLYRQMLTDVPISTLFLPEIGRAHV